MGNDENDGGFVEHPNLAEQFESEELYAYATEEICISSAGQLSFVYGCESRWFWPCLYSNIYVSTHPGHVGSDVKVYNSFPHEK